MHYCRCDFRNNPPNVIDFVVELAKLEKAIKRLLGAVNAVVAPPSPATSSAPGWDIFDAAYRDPLRDLLQKVKKTSTVLASGTFGQFLENFLDYSDYPPDLLIDHFSSKSSHAVVAGSNLDIYCNEINTILARMAQLYIDTHSYNKTIVYRKLKEFISLSRILIDAAYAFPSLGGPSALNDGVRLLDNFVWEITQQQKLDQPWSIPRWAAIREHCDFYNEDGDAISVYTVAVSTVAAIMEGYAGGPLPEFKRIPSDAKEKMSDILRTLRNQIDPFQASYPWCVVALIKGKLNNYYLPNGHL